MARQALYEARVGLAAVLTLSVVVVPAGRGRSASRGTGQVVAEDALLSSIRAHPGSRSEDIAVGLGTNMAGVRPALVALKQAGAIVVEGKARATRYSVVSREAIFRNIGDSTALQSAWPLATLRVRGVGLR